MARKTINPFCGLSEFWSLRCCTVPVLLASSMATVTPSACQLWLESSAEAFKALFVTMPLLQTLLLVITWASGKQRNYTFTMH